MSTRGKATLQLEGRLGLSVAEAARAIGVSERHLRQCLPEIPHLHVGRRVVIPTESFKEWLRARAQGEARRVERAVEDVLETLR